MPDLGVRLQLFLGKRAPAPAPFDIVDALESLEVRNNDRERDAFQLTFFLGRVGAAREYALLAGGLLEPTSRVCIAVVIQGRRQVLIDGLIARQQLVPSPEPGQSRLYVTGESAELQLDLHEQSKVFRKLSDSQIVQRILQSYPDLRPEITSTDDQRVSTQQITDLAFVHELARKNSFVFFTEPAGQPGSSLAYWGPPHRKGLPVQPPLTLNMLGETNVAQLSFDFDALGPTDPQTAVVELDSRRELPIRPPEPLAPPLAKQSAKALRTTIERKADKLTLARGRLLALQALSEARDAVVGSGQLDAAAYGAALRSRRRVAVRGVGLSYDGEYYVKQVTHRIRRGEYTQQFTLTREGRGAASGKVRP